MAERTYPGLTTLLSHLSDLEKVEAAKTVAATMDTPGWGVLVDLLEVLKGKRLVDLVELQTMKSQAEYASALAEVRGMGVVVKLGQTVLGVGEMSARRLSEQERSGT